MKLLLKQAAEQDILHEVERYAALGVPRVGERFYLAARNALDKIIARPLAGSPKILSNPALVVFEPGR